MSSLKIITKSKEVATHFKKILKAHGYGLDWCRSYSSFPKKPDNPPVKAIFLDAEIVKDLGKGIYQKVSKMSSKTAIVLIYSEGDQDLVREAMDLGAYGCIRAPYTDWEITKIATFLATRP